MPISSNTLFHFTSSLDNLLGILEYNFQPRYNAETIYLGGVAYRFVYPMVCFCDIPLSQTRNQIELYGNYGLGLSKGWGINHRLNPVLYLEDNSLLSDYIDEISDLIGDIADENSNLAIETMNEFIKHIKPYKGSFRKRGQTLPNYLFYDEKEWRYVPRGTKLIARPQQYNSDYMNKLNRELNAESLNFKPEDIKYIIIQNSQELDKVIEELQRIKGAYNKRLIDRVVSRIITTEQINEDF